MKQSFLFLVLFLITTLAFSQEEVEDSLLQQLNTATTSETRFHTLVELGEYARRFSLEKSRAYLEQAMTLANEEANEEWIANVKTILGRVEATSGNYDVALILCEEALNTYQKTGNIPKILLSTRNLGIVTRRKGDFLESVKILERAKLYFDSDEISDKEKGATLNSLSNAYSQINLYSKAIETIFESIKYSEKTGSKKALGYSYGNLGLIYYEQEKFDDAIINFEKSLAILKKEHDLLGQMNALTNLSAVYARKEDFKKELELRIEVLALSKKLKSEERIWSAKMNLIGSYLNIKEYSKAEAILKELKVEDIQENLRYLFTYHNLSHYFYAETGQHKKALESAKKMLELAQKMGDNQQMASALEAMHDAYFKNKQPDKAYQYLLEYQAVKDSLINDSNIEALTTQKLQLEFAKEQEVLESEIHIQKLTRWALSVLLVFIGIIVILGYRYYKNENQLLAKDLENKKVIEAQADELKRYNEELKTLDETKTRFFSNISHEFKTPLTLIINPVSRLLQSNNLNDEERFLVKSAEQNSLQLLALTNQVLELTKFEVNKVTTNPIIFNFRQATNKLYADFESLASSQKLQFEKQVNIDEALNVNLDYTKFTTIIKNLLSNAIKFTPENGQVILKAVEHSDTIEIRVVDTGRGIHASDLPHIFDRYYQAKITSQIQEGGTGIGLAICSEYAKLLGGDLQVQSDYGQGSSFVLTLPKVIAAADAIPNQLFLEKNTIKEAARQVFQTENTNSELPTILIVEDNEDMQNYLRLILKGFYQLEIAPHGKAALEILKEKHQSIRLIISDAMMPEMDGYTLLENLKKDKHYAAIPTIMLTALSGTDDKLKALRIGIDDYLTKPFVDEELLVRIDNLIENREERISFIGHHTDEATEKVQAEVNPVDLEWLANLEEYVTQNLRKVLIADVIATQLNVSRRTLYSKIKTLTGLTPSQYVNEIKYQTARRLIEEHPNWTVKAIALKVGFKDERNFSRNFKKRFGRNPSEYL